MSTDAQGAIGWAAPHLAVQPSQEKSTHLVTTLHKTLTLYCETGGVGNNGMKLPDRFTQGWASQQSILVAHI